MTGFLRRLKCLFPGQQRAQDEEIREELAALEQFASRKELGNLTQIAEEARAILGFPILHGLGADIRYAWRTLKRDKVFTVVALLSLSVGLGANVAVFGLMDALLWRQLPIQRPDQLVSFENTSRSYFGYSEFAKHSGKALQSVIAQSMAMEASSIGPSGSTIKRQVQFVSGNYFAALGISAALGRPIEPFDDDLRQPSPATIISYSYWRKAFGADSKVIGRAVYVGRAKFQIIGVAPQDFFGLSVGEAPELWLPIASYPMVFPAVGPAPVTGKNYNWLSIFGRLRNGVGMTQAQAILSPVSVEIDIERNASYPAALERRAMLNDSVVLLPASKGISLLRARFSRPLQVVFGMLAIGLLLACINIISLQIARSDESRKEFSIRLAIGAGRFRIVRQCLIETFALSLLSGCIAILTFKPISTALVSVMTVWGEMPAHLPLAVDSRLLTFVALSIGAVAVLCGLLPSLYASRRNLQAGLRSGPPFITGRRRPTSLVRIIGVIQVAVSLIMVTATCLFALNLGNLRGFDSGIHRDRLLEVELDPLGAGYTEPQAVLLDERLRSRLASMPGIEHATYSEDGIYSGRNSSGTFELAPLSGPGTARYGFYDYVGPDFFTTLGTPILTGRDFTRQDTAASTPVVIINQTFAGRFFPRQDPVGRTLYVSGDKNKSGYRIVGVVRDVKSNLRSVTVAWYLAAQQCQVHPFTTNFLVRPNKSTSAIMAAVKAAFRNEDPKLQISGIHSADDLFAFTVETDRLLAALGWTFGILAVLLASAGIYGLLSYDVAKRRSEIGIRTALGAKRSDIANLMLTQAAFIIVCGLLLGGISAHALTQLVRSLVFDMKASDPRIELTAAMILIAVGLAASWFPIQRAVRVDPMQALRTE